MASIFGGGGGSKTVETTGTQEFKLPSWVSDASQGIFNSARDLAARPYPTANGSLVAPLNADQLASFDLARSNIGNWQNAFQAAMSGGQAAGGPVTTADIQRYMNPYTSSVLDPTLSRMLDQYRVDTNSRHDNWASRGSYLNEDRRDLIDARAGADFNQSIGQVAGGLNMQAFQNALGQANTDKTRGLATSQFMAQLAPMLQQLGLGDSASLEAIGGTQQAQQQRTIDSRRAEQLAAFGYPQNQQSYLAQLIAGLPTNHTTTTTQQQLVPTSNGAGGFLGGLATIGGLGNSFGLWGPGTTGGGLASLFGAGGAAGSAGGLGGIGTILSASAPTAGGTLASLGFLSTKAAKDKTGDAPAVLDALADLPIQKWRYKPELGDPSEHIGPYAEDFAQAFGVGDGKTIAMVDMAGVMLKAMQELGSKLDARA